MYWKHNRYNTNHSETVCVFYAVVSFISNRIQQWNNIKKNNFVDISKYFETLLHLSVVTRAHEAANQFMGHTNHAQFNSTVSYNTYS